MTSDLNWLIASTDTQTVGEYQLAPGTHFSPVLLSVWCSNDVVQFGTITLLSGGPKPQQTEYDSHPGDAASDFSDTGLL